MDLDTFKPTFLIEIEGQSLSKDITQEIESFSFTDNEEELDELELKVSNRNLQFVDDPLFQEGNEIVARFGYVGNLSPRKKAVIKEIDYDFPEKGAPTIRIKASDKGHKLAGKQNQKVWQKPAPGIAYSEIAEEVASANGLRPVVTATRDQHLRVAQSNISDAQFLQELAAKARAKDGDGVTGYAFYVQDDELHFHPRDLEAAPALTLEYFTDRKGLLRSFRPSTQSQGAKGAGVETKAVGVDPRKKEPVEHTASNDTTPERSSLGSKTYLVDGNTGEGAYKEQESGEIVPSFERSEAFDQEPRQEPAQDAAEGKFKEAEMRQVEATAKTIGVPSLRAKQNVEVTGVGAKFSGVYYCHSVRHKIDGRGYSCELKLKKNALGKGAGEKAGDTQGTANEQEAIPNSDFALPLAEMVSIDAESGARLN
jgi:phage protein D